MSTISKKLNVGCGTDVKQGWVNLDSAKLPGVDVVHDIEKIPFPFHDAEFNEILCQDVLEHADWVPVLRDLHRVLKKGGTITIRVPHFTSKNNFIDPTHKRRFSINTFDFFVVESPLYKERPYYFDFSFTHVATRIITFEKSSRLFLYNRLMEWLVNHSLSVQKWYESTGWSRLFPSENIIVKLIK